MLLFEEILLEKWKEHSICFTAESCEKIVEQESYKALQKIKAVLEDDSLDDPECFMKIERIIRIFEEIGSDGGNRHDFG